MTRTTPAKTGSINMSNTDKGVLRKYAADVAVTLALTKASPQTPSMSEAALP